MAAISHRDMALHALKAGSSETAVISLMTGEEAIAPQRATSMDFTAHGAGCLRTSTGLVRVADLLHIRVGKTGDGEFYIEQAGAAQWLNTSSSESAIKYGAAKVLGIITFVNTTSKGAPLVGCKMLRQTRGLQDSWREPHVSKDSFSLLSVDGQLSWGHHHFTFQRQMTSLCS